MKSKRKISKKYTKRKYRSITDLIEKESNIFKYAGFTPEEAEVCFWSIANNYFRLLYKQYSKKKYYVWSDKLFYSDPVVKILNNYLKLSDRGLKIRGIEITFERVHFPLKVLSAKLIFYQENFKKISDFALISKKYAKPEKPNCILVYA